MSWLREKSTLILDSDDRIADGTAMAAWPDLPMAISPAGCQVSVEGFHDKIEVG